MKKAALVLLALLLLNFCSCTSDDGKPDASSAVESSAAEASTEASAEVSEVISEEPSNEISEEISEEVSEEMLKKIPLPENVKVQTNLDFDNKGKKMGDSDGPAYCVYSKVGYNKASMDVLISKLKVNSIRKSDKKFVNMYMFLGCDVLSSPTGWWVNCFDCGFCYSGSHPSWHLFYNIYEPATENQAGWYESSVKLDPTHDYRLILDTSSADEKAYLLVYDLTDGKKADEATFYVKNLKADGSSTSYLMDFAIDYPGNTKMGVDGKPSEDWFDITLYNTDEDLYLQNIIVENVKIWKNGAGSVWDNNVTDHRALWPDCNMKEIDYPCTFLVCDEENYDSSFRVDLDMNRD